MPAIFKNLFISDGSIFCILKVPPGSSTGGTGRVAAAVQTCKSVGPAKWTDGAAVGPDHKWFGNKSDHFELRPEDYGMSLSAQGQGCSRILR